MTFAYFEVEDCERISYIEEISILESLRDSVLITQLDFSSL